MRWGLRLSLLLVLAARAWGGEAQWLEVKSPHFSVVTDAGEKRGREVAVRFEQMRSVFGSLLTKSTVNLPVPLQIVAFRNTKEIRQFAPLWKGKPTDIAGLFEYREDRGFILLDMSTEEPWQTVFHEYAHQLMNGNTTLEAAPWFDEGFAEYFSTIKVAGKEADVGLVQQDDFQILQHMGWLRTIDLFRVQQNSSVYNESGDHRSVFYAQSWLMVHYLYDKQMVLKAGDYFKLVVRDHVPVEEATKRAFGMSGEEWDKAMRKYFNTNEFRYAKLPTPAEIETTGYSVKPMSLANAKAVLADAHMHSPDYQDKAIAEFEDVLKLEPDNAAALRGLGYGYLGKQDFSRAGEYFRKAAAKDSTDPRVFYYSAVLQNREEGGNLRSDPQSLEVMAKDLERSIALDPTFADAYGLLAYAYLSQDRGEDALKAAIKAVTLNPRNEGYLLNLAQIYVLNQKTDEAIRIYQALQSSSNPQIAGSATMALQQAREYKEAVARLPAVTVRNTGETTESAGGETHPAVIEPEPVVMLKPVPTQFLKGKLVSVDCSTPPGAVLTISAGVTTWKMHTADSGRTVLIGADKFSCAWTNQKVAVNYRETGKGTGEVISLEIQ